MTNNIQAFQTHPRGCLANLWITPGTSQTQITGLTDQMLKVRSDKPPGLSETNRELVYCLRRCFKVKPELISGRSEREKIVILPELTVQLAFNRLALYLKTPIV